MRRNSHWGYLAGIWERGTASRPSLLTSGENLPLNKNLGGSKNQSGNFWEEKNPLFLPGVKEKIKSNSGGGGMSPGYQSLMSLWPPIIWGLKRQQLVSSGQYPSAPSWVRGQKMCHARSLLTACGIMVGINDPSTLSVRLVSVSSLGHDITIHI